jgi:hypothetical protein
MVCFSNDLAVSGNVLTRKEFRRKHLFRKPFIRSRPKTQFFYGPIPLVFEMTIALASGLWLTKHSISADRPRLADGYVSELRKFPAATLGKTLDSVYIFKRSSLGSGRPGPRAFVRNRTVYCSDPSRFVPMYATILTRDFAKRFSLRKHWQELYPTPHVRRQIEAHAGFGGTIPLHRLHENGLVEPICLKGPDHDIAATMSWLYARPGELFQLADRNRVIEKKVHLLSEFIGLVIESTTGERRLVNRDYFLHLAEGRTGYPPGKIASSPRR